MDPPLDILHEDNHCLAVAKPGGIASAHFQGTEQTLDRLVKQYLKTQYQKAGNVFLGIVHRLDKPVSGVLLFARTSKAAARLSEQFREGTIEKVYWAVVEGDVNTEAGTLEDWLKIERSATAKRVEVVAPRASGARQSLLHFQKRAQHGGLTLLEVRPQTGRTHQLRVQLAHHGHPIYADARYGSIHTFGRAIGLHAQSDVPASGALRADHADRGGAAGVARPIRVLAEGSANMSDAVLDRLRNLVQEDVGNRGLRSDPERNLISETAGDFRAACADLAGSAAPGLAVVTGFFIPTANPPAGETDGPLGAVFLARALVPLGIRVAIAADGFCIPALQAGLAACELSERVLVVSLPAPAEARRMGAAAYRDAFQRATAGVGLTHVLAIECVGPSHCHAEVPAEHQDRCHTMRGLDITDHTSPAHWLFEKPGISTIGIGDGGNEIGMGKLAWDVIQRNIPRGGLIACRVPTDQLIVAGVSNWGAYALAAGVYHRRGAKPSPELFDPVVEQRILEVMVERGPLVDGVLSKPSVTVDGLTWERYSAVLPELAACG